MRSPFRRPRTPRRCVARARRCRAPWISPISSPGSSVDAHRRCAREVDRDGDRHGLLRIADRSKLGCHSGGNSGDREQVVLELLDGHARGRNRWRSRGDHDDGGSARRQRAAAFVERAHVQAIRDHHCRVDRDRQRAPVETRRHGGQLTARPGSRSTCEVREKGERDDRAIDHRVVAARQTPLPEQTWPAWGCPPVRRLPRRSPQRVICSGVDPPVTVP